MEITPETLVFLAIVTAPVAVVIIVALLRSYHMDLRLWRGHKQQEGHDDNGDH